MANIRSNEGFNSWDAIRLGTGLMLGGWGIRIASKAMSRFVGDTLFGTLKGAGSYAMRKGTKLAGRSYEFSKNAATSAYSGFLSGYRGEAGVGTAFMAGSRARALSAAARRSASAFSYGFSGRGPMSAFGGTKYTRAAASLGNYFGGGAAGLGASKTLYSRLQPHLGDISQRAFTRAMRVGGASLGAYMLNPFSD